MRRFLRVGFIVALATSLRPAAVAAQTASSDSLRHRIEVLERAMLDLQSRVRELEAQDRKSVV